ncbi:MAG: hypothetical protein K8T89_15045 [Planctomycetes bacterium]|nr:hypothetical protein [Planctomycetota bacterium]
MTSIEAYQRAATDLGDIGAEEMAAYIAREFSIVIAPQYIPIFRATLLYQKTGSRSPKAAESPRHLQAERLTMLARCNSRLDGC